MGAVCSKLKYLIFLNQIIPLCYNLKYIVVTKDKKKKLESASISSTQSY